MQAAAMAPVALDETSISQADIDKELEIGKALAIKEGKPEEMAQNIAKGRLKKWFKEVTLVHQAFIKNNKQSVADYVKEVGGGDRAITGFSRVSLDLVSKKKKKRTGCSKGWPVFFWARPLNRRIFTLDEIPARSP